MNDETYPLTIKSIRDKLLGRYDKMNVLSDTKNSGEYEKYLYIKPQYKGSYITCVRYGHKVKDWWHI